MRSERRDTPFTLFATASIHAKDRCQFVLHPYSTDHVAYIVGKMGAQFERDIVVDKGPIDGVFYALIGIPQPRIGCEKEVFRNGGVMAHFEDST